MHPDIPIIVIISEEISSYGTIAIWRVVVQTYCRYCTIDSNLTTQQMKMDVEQFSITGLTSKAYKLVRIS